MTNLTKPQCCCFSLAWTPTGRSSSSCLFSPQQNFGGVERYSATRWRQRQKNSHPHVKFSVNVSCALFMFSCWTIESNVFKYVSYFGSSDSVQLLLIVLFCSNTCLCVLQVRRETTGPKGSLELLVSQGWRASEVSKVCWDHNICLFVESHACHLFKQRISTL